MCSLGVAGALVAARLLAPDSWIYAAEFGDARETIARIESFRASRGVLPETLTEVGRTDDEQGPLYYVRNDDHFTLSFAAPTHGFFGTYVYDSARATWHVGD